jgi:hypothetical protein
MDCVISSSPLPQTLPPLPAVCTMYLASIYLEFYRPVPLTV